MMGLGSMLARVAGLTVSVGEADLSGQPPLSSGEGTVDIKGQGIPPMRDLAAGHSSRVHFVSSKASDG